MNRRVLPRLLFGLPGGQRALGAHEVGGMMKNLASAARHIESTSTGQPLTFRKTSTARCRSSTLLRCASSARLRAELTDAVAIATATNTSSRMASSTPIRKEVRRRHEKIRQRKSGEHRCEQSRAVSAKHGDDDDRGKNSNEMLGWTRSQMRKVPAVAIPTARTAVA